MAVERAAAEDLRALRADLHYLDGNPFMSASAGGAGTTAGTALRNLRLAAAGRRRDLLRLPGNGKTGRALELARSTFVFNPQLRSLTHGFKYRPGENLAGFLAGDMAARWRGFPNSRTINFACRFPCTRPN